MSVREYIGARYVPVFADPIQWDVTLSYEPLTVVMNLGTSYVSRQSVPAGIAIDNEQYWIRWADYNAQLEEYIRQVQAYDGRITATENGITSIDNALPIADFSSENTVKDAIDAAGAGVSAIETVLPIADFSSENTVKDAIDAIGASATAIEAVLPIADFSSENTVKDAIDAVEDSVSNLSAKIDVENGSTLAVQVVGEFDCSKGLNLNGHIGGICEASNGDIVCIGNSLPQIAAEGFWRRFNIKGNNDFWTSALTNANVGHANSICYNPTLTRFIVVPLYQTSGGVQQAVQEFWIYDGSGNLVDTKSTPTIFYAISYDYTTGKMYAMSGENGFKLYEVADDFTCTLVTELDDVDFQSPQDIAVKGNTLVMNDVWGNFTIINLETLESRDYKAYCNSHKLGEPAGITFTEDGALLMAVALWQEQNYVEEYGLLCEIILDKNYYSEYSYAPRSTTTTQHVNQKSTALRFHKNLTVFNYFKYTPANLHVVFDDDYTGLIWNPEASNLFLQTDHTLTIDKECYVTGSLRFLGSGVIQFGDLKITGTMLIPRIIVFNGALTVKSTSVRMMDDDGGVQYFYAGGNVTFETFTHVWNNRPLNKSVLMINQAIEPYTP